MAAPFPRVGAGTIKRFYDMEQEREWPAFKVERRATEALRHAPTNARTHSEEQIEQIAASIEAFGWTIPILIEPDGMIIAGHGRQLAAQKLGIAEVPCIVAVGWSDQQRRAYMLADNKIAENSEWDDDLLRLELGALLDEADAASLVIGFSDAELDGLVAALAADQEQPAGKVGNLKDRFGVAPFSVLNAREGWWQERKRAWIALGIRSELGRGEGDRACPGGGPLPGARSRKGYKPGQATEVRHG